MDNPIVLLGLVFVAVLVYLHFRRRPVSIPVPTALSLHGRFPTLTDEVATPAKPGIRPRGLVEIIHEHRLTDLLSTKKTTVTGASSVTIRNPAGRDVKIERAEDGRLQITIL